jgi:hypothetical protein
MNKSLVKNLPKSPSNVQTNVSFAFNKTPRQYYKLRNRFTNAIMFYDELSDYLYSKGWYIERDAKDNEIDYLDILAIERDIISEISE